MQTDFQFEKMIEKISGSEGPAVDAEDHTLMVSPGKGQVLWIRDGMAAEIVNTAGTPAGLQIDSEGRVWIADMKHGILRLEKDRTLTRLVTEFEGAPIRGCNDLSLDDLGRLYFTAPAGSGKANHIGEVFWRDEKGGVKRFDQGLSFPNGIAVAADRRWLVYAETFTRKLWRWTLDKSGNPVQRDLFATLPGGDDLLGGDGMDFDAEGFLLATHYGAGEIDVYDPKGNLVEQIKLPFKKPSNVEPFQDGSGRWLVTEQENSALWRFQWRRGGARIRKIGVVPACLDSAG